MLASESLNHFLRQKERALRLSEANLTFRCGRCSLSIPGDQARVSREATAVVYRCPHDGEELGTVSQGKFGKGGGDILLPGELWIRVGGESLGFYEFMSELIGK